MAMGFRTWMLTASTMLASLLAGFMAPSSWALSLISARVFLMFPAVQSLTSFASALSSELLLDAVLPFVFQSLLNLPGPPIISFQ